MELPRRCNIWQCEMPATQCCPHCGTVVYCDEAHAALDWPLHHLFCTTDRASRLKRAATIFTQCANQRKKEWDERPRKSRKPGRRQACEKFEPLLFNLCGTERLTGECGVEHNLALLDPARRWNDPLLCACCTQYAVPPREDGSVDPSNYQICDAVREAVPAQTLVLQYYICNWCSCGQRRLCFESGQPVDACGLATRRWLLGIWMNRRLFFTELPELQDLAFRILVATLEPCLTHNDLFEIPSKKF
jgi:hypothetical protein